MKCKNCGENIEKNDEFCNRLCYFEYRKKKQHCYSNLYRRWIDMKARCYNKNNCNYKYYGGRGIKVCDEWLNNYENFEKWALQNGYKKELTLDKINNNGNYEPQNCRWVNQRIQNINKRPSKKNKIGFVGIKLSSNKRTYYGSVKINNKDYYTGCSSNIIEAAIMRNNYIIDNKLDNKLNDLSEFIGKYNMELRYEPK